MPKLEPQVKTCKCGFTGDKSLFKPKSNWCNKCTSEYHKQYESGAKCKEYRMKYRQRKKVLDYYRYKQEMNLN